MKRPDVRPFVEKGQKWKSVMEKRVRRHVKLVRTRPWFVVRHFLMLLAIRLLCIIITLALMSLIIVFVPSLAAAKERMKLRQHLPKSFVHRAVVQVTRLTDPSEIVDIFLNAPQEVPQALRGVLTFVVHHTKAWFLLLQTNPTLRAGLVAMFVTPLGKHPRILQEALGFLFAFFLVQLAEPYLLPLFDVGMTEEEALATSVGYTSLLRLNTAILFRVVLRSAVRMAARSALFSIGNKLGALVGPWLSCRVERAAEFFLPAQLSSANRTMPVPDSMTASR